MKRVSVKKISLIFIIVCIILLILDYINLPNLMGFNMSNINWNFFMGMINIIIVIVLYLITFITLDQRTVQREDNKNEISILLMKHCYQECIEYAELLDQKVVEKYIVPKMDFNSTDNTIINNLRNAPFINETIIMDLVKDGQVETKHIEEYLKIKGRYQSYITMRITFYDNEQYYQPVEYDLYNLINNEVDNLDQ